MSVALNRMGRSVVDLEVGDCERLIATVPIGRIGFSIGGRPVILPVNFRYVDGSVVFRTGLGSKLHAVAAEKAVAFEVDEWDEKNRVGWSVLISGSASEIEEFGEFHDADLLDLFPWAEAEEQDRLVRIVPDKITGRWIL